MKRNALRQGLLLICFAFTFTFTCMAQSPAVHWFIQPIKVYALPPSEIREAEDAVSHTAYKTGGISAGHSGGLKDQLYWIVGLTALSCMGIYVLIKMRK